MIVLSELTRSSALGCDASHVLSDARPRPTKMEEERVVPTEAAFRRTPIRSPHP